MTIKDIARLAQVSVSTVSKVLNNKDENITEETRKRVLDVARQYQFTPYKNIRDQLSVSSHTIALIVPDVASPFFSGLITAIEQEVRALGYCNQIRRLCRQPQRDTQRQHCLRRL